MNREPFFLILIIYVPPSGSRYVVYKRINVFCESTLSIRKESNSCISIQMILALKFQKLRYVILCLGYQMLQLVALKRAAVSLSRA